MPLVDLGAEVIKVEPPAGDYIREMTWPIVEGVSLMHLHINRGKRSIVMDLRTDEDVATFKELAAGVRRGGRGHAPRRPGPARRRLRGPAAAINPRLVFCTISGYGMTGPYQDLPAHGIAFDTWAGIVTPQVNEDGFAYLPEHASMGIHAGPLFGALGILAAVLRAKTTGEGSFLEIAQSDAAAAMDWYRSETWKAYERPESEVTGNKADDYERREPGTAGMIEGVRYQVYEAKDGRYVLFMASEQAFWKNFCEAVEPHGAVRAVARLEVRRPRPRQPRAAAPSCATSSAPGPPRSGSSSAIDGQRSRSPRSTRRRPSPRTPSSRTASTGIRPERLGAEQLPTPLKFVGEELPVPAHAPTVGEHTDEVLARRPRLGRRPHRRVAGPGRPRRRRRREADRASPPSSPRPPAVPVRPAFQPLR